MSLEDELAEHLAGKATPFLFVGAGMSRRYVGLDGWEGLLTRFADLAGKKPYGRYFSDAAGDFPSIASAMAEDFNPVWWEGDEYAERRAAHQHLRDPESPLKVEVAHLMADVVDRLDPDGAYAEELDLLRAVTVDGIITTNYDPLLEHLFPDFKAFVGQTELLFSEVQTIGEIYKIHGSHERPDSLVLTAADYASFESSNAYLAAKLLTIFVDHPVVFLGYSLQDRNVTKILNAIAKALDTDHLNKLADRLVYITRDRDARDPHLGHGTFAVEGGVIPMRTAAVNDYAPVYRALGRNSRQLPAQLLRRVKERVYDLVLTSDPVGSLKVVNMDDDRVEDMDVVFGVGAVARLGSLGYFGLDRLKLIDDVLEDNGNYDPKVLISDVIPKLFKGPTFLPIVKYARGAGLLNDAGKLTEPKAVDPKIAEHIKSGRNPFGPTGEGYRKADKRTAAEHGSFAALAKAEPDPKKVLRIVHAFADEDIELDALREYLIRHRARFVDGYSDKTLLAKAVCLYDWLKHAQA